MFAVHETREEREATIRKFAEQDVCVGVLLAAANLEWTLSRCIYAMGNRPVSVLRKEHIASLDAYKEMWKREVARGDVPALARLMECIKCPQAWMPENRKSAKLAKGRSGWQVLQYAMNFRHNLIHGKQGTAEETFGNTVVNVLLEAARKLEEFARTQGAPIFGKRLSRRNPFIVHNHTK